ncbi:MAG: hypothetical protein ACK5W9_04655, partial [Bdellovibrionales bacterium]
MAKTSNLFSRILGRLQLRSEGEAPAAAEENRINPTPKAVIETKKEEVDSFSLYSGSGNLFAIKMIADE